MFRILVGCNASYIAGLCGGVAAGLEHDSALTRLWCRTVVDIGANRGQFALVARRHFPQASVFAFEPLPGPAGRFRKVFAADSKVILHETAIGPKDASVTIHVSAKDDSSSLLPITPFQEQTFPGTGEIERLKVEVAPLVRFLSRGEIVNPALLKLDVQGYELEALRGCEELLGRFDVVYCECSFVELYTGQALAGEVIDWLRDREFDLGGVYNTSYDRTGRAVQADFLFRRRGAANGSPAACAS